MSKFRTAARIDANQNDIVDALRSIPGVTVEVGVNDIFVGYRKKNYWFEIKNPEKVSKKTEAVVDSAIKDSQVKLVNHWTGHYSIVWSLDQILSEIGILK